jgi:chemotaxis protein MotB
VIKVSKKKKHHHEEHVDESWLIPYADIMTLLLALFIVLFASADTDSEKLKQMSETFREAFSGGEGILLYDSTSPMNNVPHTPILSDTEPENLSEKKQEEMENLEELQQRLEMFIEEKGLSLNLKTKLTESG